MFIDSHCHLTSPKYKDAEKVVEGAKGAGVVKLITVGTSVADSKASLAVAEKFANVYSTAGIYPHEDKNSNIGDVKIALQSIAGLSKKGVGIGEGGIDITNRKNQRPIGDQINLFQAQIELALETGLPLIIHNRNGDEHILSLLDKNRSKGLKGVVHCFTGSWDFAQKILAFGFYISFSGIITYPTGNDILETVINVPPDRFLVETDAPYLPPQPYKDTPNEPKYVRIVAEQIAKVRNTPLDFVEKQTYNNTCALFNI